MSSHRIPKPFVAPDSLVSKRLLTALIRFAEGDSLAETLTTGIFHDRDGRPVLHCYPLPPLREGMEERIREAARRWLKLASVDLDLLEGRLAGVGVACEMVSPIRTQRGSCTRPQAGPGWLVPVVRHPHQWPIAVMAVALLTGVSKRGDVLANRVGLCEGCRQFYVRKISRPSRACSPKCRRVLAA